MALSDEQIDKLMKPNRPYSSARAIERAVEAKVRTDYDALIRQMLDALESVNQAMPFPVASAAITAAKARLGES